MDKKQELEVVLNYLKERINDLNRQALAMSDIEDERELTEREENTLSILIDEMMTYRHVATTVDRELAILRSMK